MTKLHKMDSFFEEDFELITNPKKDEELKEVLNKKKLSKFELDQFMNGI